DGDVLYHLGGARVEFRPLIKKKLIFDTVRLWANEIGARVFHLGGGVGAREVFFSSRRPHTTSLRDWSSDVCSSDLGPAATPGRGQHQWQHQPGRELRGKPDLRSEERRVGQESRSRWSAYQ